MKYQYLVKSLLLGLATSAPTAPPINDLDVTMMQSCSDKPHPTLVDYNIAGVAWCEKHVRVNAPNPPMLPKPVIDPRILRSCRLSAPRTHSWCPTRTRTSLDLLSSQHSKFLDLRPSRERCVFGVGVWVARVMRFSRSKSRKAIFVVDKEVLLWFRGGIKLYGGMSLE